MPEMQEWDPATGKMMATQIEIDAPEAAPEVKAAPSEPAVVQADLSRWQRPHESCRSRFKLSEI